jgi:hypothetical protein
VPATPDDDAAAFAGAAESFGFVSFGGAGVVVSSSVVVGALGGGT